MRKILLLISVFMLCSLLRGQTTSNDSIDRQVPDLSDLETKMGEAFYGGRYKEAGEISMGILDSIIKYYGKNHSLYGEWLDNTGVVLHHGGDYNTALSFLEKGVSHGRIYPPETIEYFPMRLSNLGMLYRDLGRYGQALQHIQEAVDKGKEILGEENSYYGIFLNNLGLIHEDMGQLQQALKYALEAKDITERTLGKEDTKFAIRLGNVASLYRSMNRIEEALPLYEQAQAIYEKNLGENHDFALNNKLNTARAYTIINQNEKALTIVERLVEQASNTLGADHPSLIFYYNELGGILNNLDRLVEAKTAFEKGLRNLQMQGRYSAKWAQGLYINLANLEEKLGHLETASEYHLLAEQSFATMVSNQFDQMNQHDQRVMINKYGNHLPQIITFALDHPERKEVLETCLNGYLLRKELTLGYRKHLLDALTNSGNEELSQDFEAWKKLQKELAQQMSLVAEKRAENFEAIKKEAADLERSLGGQSLAFRQARALNKWEDIRANLSAGEMAIEFAHASIKDQTIYLAFMISKEAKRPQMVYLFEEKELGNLRAIRSLYKPSVSGDEANLQNLVWQKLTPHLSGVETIYLAPSGLLNRINFGAIPVDQNLTLSQKFRLHRLLNTHDLIRKRDNDLVEQPQSALVYGGINYGEFNPLLRVDSTARLTAQEMLVSNSRDFNPNESGWPYLKWSALEAEGISDILKQAHTKVDLQMEHVATEGYFKNQTSQGASPQVIHLATHGFFFPDQDKDASTGFKAASEPMIRSGLVLAGANKAWKGSTIGAGLEDGILTAYEISLLNLKETDLVVLSACDTGLGVLNGNDGIYGLQRAFKMAGAGYLIMSLWSVNDRQTEEFMSTFYRNWLEKKMDVPTAFQTSQNELRLKYAKPFNPSQWAGFILVE